jgi:hypothetical protein
MSEVVDTNDRNDGNNRAAEQASEIAMPQAFQFMTEFSLNMELFNQTLLPVMNNLIATAQRHNDTVNYLNPFIGDLRRRVNSLETRADRLEANNQPSGSADNASFQETKRTNAASGSTGPR